MNGNKVETIDCKTLRKFFSSREQDGNKNGKFPIEEFNNLIENVLLGNSNEKLIKLLKKYLTYNDIRYFMLKYILNDLDSDKLNDSSLSKLIDIFTMMPGLVKTKLQSDSDQIEAKLFFISKETLTKESKLTQVDVHRKLYNDCVVKIMRCELNKDLFKKFLVRLPDKIMPKMSNPLTMANFLTESFNMGGLMSVLALNGLFVLITSYNLEYPNFYAKVYEYLDCSIFHTRYKDRYFQLLDTFLLSTHLSINIVAAFIKKLARMSLFCPPADLRFLVSFIHNLLIRHEKCSILINRQNPKSLSEDPFDVTMSDFSKTHALSSSLWEIKTLKAHYLPDVVEAVEQFEKVAKLEKPLDDLFENNTYEAIMEQEFEKKYKNNSFNYTYDDKNYEKTFSIIKFE